MNMDYTESNKFLSSLTAAFESEKAPQSTSSQLSEVDKQGQSQLNNSQVDAADTTESHIPGDKNGTPDPNATKNNSPAAPAAETNIPAAENGFNGFTENVILHKKNNLIPLKQEVDAQSKTGNTGSPGVDGKPVSKSGDTKPLPKTEAEKNADDKSGNAGSLGVDGDPAASFDSFIATCQELVIDDTPGTADIPESMSLESYTMQLGMSELASRACESSMSAAERRALPNSMFALPDERKYPMNDKSHVSNAITYFRFVPENKQREVAKNILKFIRKYDMKDITCTKDNPFVKYYPEAHIVERKKPAKKTEASNK